MSIRPPTFASRQDFVDKIRSVEYWYPHIHGVLRKHNLDDQLATIMAGHNSTNPTFLCNDVVVKFFGYWPPHAENRFQAELDSYSVLGECSHLPVPTLLHHGQLFDSDTGEWQYLILSRSSGRSLRDARIDSNQMMNIAKDLGAVILTLHSARIVSGPKFDDWVPSNLEASLRVSSLPEHLIRQADAFLRRLESDRPVFVNGDIVANHVFVDEGRLSTVIDWGDAMIADRHLELIQLYRDTFNLDSTLLKTFLDASNWPADSNFAQRALGVGLCRQAIGCVQHGKVDVFEPIAAKYPLNDIATLDELATLLFDA